MSKFLAIITAAVLSGAFATSANAQAAPQNSLKCNQLTSATPADGGYKRIGIKAPKANVNGQRVTMMNVQVYMTPTLGRTDAGLEQPKIVQVWDCADNVGYHVRAASEPEHDTTEVVVPENLPKGTKLQVCAGSYQTKCVSAAFDGDFTKWVILAPGGAPAAKTQISGKYN